MVVRTNADTPEQTQQRDRVRRRRHRPVPHRAHVLRRRPHRRDARDDPRRDARGAEGGAGQAAAVPARRLRRHLPGAEGLPGDDPLPRSAAARVPAARRTEQQAELGEEDRRHGREDSPARRAAARVQPDARLPRLPPRHRLSRRSPRCRRAPCSRRRRSCRRKGSRSAGDHDPAGRRSRRSSICRSRSCTASPTRCRPRRR